MTAFVPTASIIGSSTIFNSVAANDSVTFLQPYTFINTTTNAVNIVHDNNTVMNMTTLMSGGSYGLVVNTVNDCDIINTATGTIATLAGAGGYNAVYLGGERNTLTNAGDIYSVNGTAVYMLGTDMVLDNAGRIQGREVGIVATGTSYMIGNSGTIECVAGATAAVYLAGTGVAKVLVNTGVIQSLAPSVSTAISVQAHNTTTIENSGTVRSVGGVAIDASFATGNIHLTNSGVIIGSQAFVFAVAATALADVITNTGHINRSVGLDDGDDIFNGIGGTVGGTVYGGDGNDFYYLSDPLARVFEDAGQGIGDRVFSTADYSLATAGEVENLTLLGTAVLGTGNALANLMQGNLMGNTLLGEAGADSILGGDGNDLIDGGTEADDLGGENGDDRLLGRGGADALAGGAGEDVLEGGALGDSLQGGDGEDVLIGGRGRDILNGGADADRFVLIRLADSTAAAQGRDIIEDFEAGSDVIDLSALDARAATAANDAFAFIGTGAFTGTAGQLRYTTSGANVLISGDVNGDSIADFTLTMNTVAVLAAGDFWL